MTNEQVVALNANTMVEVKWVNGEISIVSFRGRCNGGACFWTGKIQLTIPCDWIIRTV